MKTVKYLLISFAFFFTMQSCVDFEIIPSYIVQDDIVFTSESGIRSFFARQYGTMPIEDFRFSHTNGINHFYTINPFQCLAGEAIGRDVSGANHETHNYWSEAYMALRDLHIFIADIKNYKDVGGFSDAQIDGWLGEAYFIRAMIYFGMVKRYGGVPIVTRVLELNEGDALDIPRASEEAVYNLIAEDFDRAYNLLPADKGVTRANKNTALGFKSRAMLYAGSIAKYGEIARYDNSQVRVCGIPADKAQQYFKLSYDAAKALEGQYSLYLKAWSATSKDAQYQNFGDLFFDATSAENIFIREYGYPNSVHGYDSYMIPNQWMGANGYSACVNPTLDFVEMFDGLPRNSKGQIEVFDENGFYKLFNDRMDIFVNAEPRLRATVMFPGDMFKGEALDVCRGIYHDEATIASGITRLVTDLNSTSKYNTFSNLTSRIRFSTNPTSQQTFTDKNGVTRNAGGRSGCYNDYGPQCLAGFGLRKYLDTNLPASQVLENRSDQNWIELRYAEILLNRAEAAFELYLYGQGESYRTDAYNCIKQIQERAGADIVSVENFTNTVDTESTPNLAKGLNVIRKERRKELAFENKVWYDLRRWRVIHLEQNNTVYRMLMPFYVANEDKWFYDDRFEETNKRYTFNQNWYYKNIPTARISESPSLIQNPGY